MYRIVSKEMLTPTICRMKVEAPRLAAAAQPGHFLFVRADEKGEGAIILNEYAQKKYNLNLEDKISWGMNPHEATGFCRDIHYKPLQYESEALAFYIYGDVNIWVTDHCYIRTVENADIKAVFDAIRATTDKILPD